MAEKALRLDPQTPRTVLGNFINCYFFGRKYDRVIALFQQIPEENKYYNHRTFAAASFAFLGRMEEAKRAKEDLLAKYGEQVMELWFNDGEVFVRNEEHDMEREAFKTLGMRICATPEELKKIPNAKRLPECAKD